MQTFLVTVIIAGAVIYVAARLYQNLRGKNCACDSKGCGAASKFNQKKK